VRIALDLLGGDDAPAVVVEGALLACAADPELFLHLVGPPEAADQVVAGLPPVDRHRVTVDHADDVVAMDEVPTRTALSDSTVKAGIAAVQRKAADALVSAGASGATVTAAVLGLGRLPGVRRPALAAVLPGLRAPVVLLDVGAGTDPTTANLLAHAVLGSAYAQVAGDVAAPRVGLLSIGAETGKGDHFRRAADGALRSTALPAGAVYVGLVEGQDVSLGQRADVVVTDGFTGNVLLKGIEGAYALAGGGTQPQTATRAAVLLGVAGAVVVCHGAAKAKDIASGLALAARLHRQQTMSTIAAITATLQEPS
jgi:glycerol-3-phosphate acyltransferase PlsX